MKIKSVLFYFYLASLGAYALFTLLPTPTPAVLQQYKLSVLGVRLITISITAILALVWYITLSGYDRLRRYSRLIKDDKDGIHVAQISRGMFFIAIWLPISSVIPAIVNYFVRTNAGIMPGATIIDNYINLALPLIGFVLIGWGARGLAETFRIRASYKVLNVLVILLIYVGLIYYHLVISSHGRQQIYHLSIWMLLTTFIAPYIFMWASGLRAAYVLYLYQAKVKGIVYRQAWKLLSMGLAWLIVTTIGFQFLTTLANRLSSLSIYWLLFIIYAALSVLSVGFVLIALGTKKLQKIEEV